MEREEEKTEAERAQEKARLEQALNTLKHALMELCEKAGKTAEYGENLWERMKGSNGVLREFAYYHDYGNFYGRYQVAGFTLLDILVWQVDHFKAYMDRHEQMNRYHTERLLLESLDIMLRMEKDPTPYVAKMKGETGTDYTDKF